MTDTVPDDRLRELAKKGGFAGWDLPKIEDVKKVLLGGGPAGVAPVVLWLASDEAQHVNGEVFMATEGAVALFSHMTEVKYVYNNSPFSTPEISKAMRAIMPKPS